MKKQDIYKGVAKSVLVIFMIMVGVLQSRAQLNPFQSMYFQNPYLYNPATAGLYKGLNLNIGYRQQWSNIPGAPKTTAGTMDFNATDKVGLGLNVNDDKTGLIRQTRIMGTYAYHLPLSDRGQKLSFGLSLGVNDSRVDYNSINGDLGDGEVAQYNQLKAYVDGDLGIAYTSNSLNIGGALPNLKSAFFKSSDDRFDADKLLFITIVTYKISLQSDNNNFMFEPLAGMRAVKGYNNIYDLGFNFMMQNYGLFFQGIYHSSRSMGLGFGIDQQAYALNFNYNLETGQLSNFTHGAFELGMCVRLFKNAH